MSKTEFYVSFNESGYTLWWSKFDHREMVEELFNHGLSFEKAVELVDWLELAEYSEEWEDEDITAGVCEVYGKC